MCGIAGIFERGGGAAVTLDRLRAMLGAIRHRGPDEFGLYLSHEEGQQVGLGSARLSIIDLAGGQQPIGNESDSVWIVYNGEIFNYLELREQLERQGHRFTTDSDTEVIVHLYEQAGPACVSALNGQFAFAIWDERLQRLFLARDRLGIRPLYYRQEGGTLLFASEIKAILAGAPALSVTLDPVAIDQIFTAWSPLSPRSAFRNIQTLPPGHSLLLGQDGEPQLCRYWSPTFRQPRPPRQERIGASEIDDYAQRLRDLLIDATQIRLRADVPVGAYLSGGLDSSIIAALIHRYTGRRLETFSMAFSDSAYDESSFQRQMAHHLGTRHNLIQCTHEQIGEVFPDVIWHTEVPLVRTSPAPLFLLSRLVHDHGFKVVLTGEGADEILAGYGIFKEDKIRRFWARQPASTLRPQLLRKLYPYVAGLSQGQTAYLQRFFAQGLLESESPGYSHAIRWRNTSRGKRLFSRSLRAALAERGGHLAAELPLPPEYATWGGLEKAQYLEMTIFLSEYLLSSQGDRVAMAHSVEGRFPFLDHRLVEYCSQLPPRLKLHALNEKYLLKRAMGDLLPEAIWRRPKQPYRAPIQHSFFPGGRPLDWVGELLSPRAIEQTDLFDVRAVALLRGRIERDGTLGETDQMALAAVLSTQLLDRQFVRHFQPPPPIGEHERVKTILRGRHYDPIARSNSYES